VFGGGAAKVIDGQGNQQAVNSRGDDSEDGKRAQSERNNVAEGHGDRFDLKARLARSALPGALDGEGAIEQAAEKGLNLILARSGVLQGLKPRSILRHLRPD
jgi:hypothetical protein